MLLQHLRPSAERPIFFRPAASDQAASRFCLRWMQPGDAAALRTAVELAGDVSALTRLPKIATIDDAKALIEESIRRRWAGEGFAWLLCGPDGGCLGKISLYRPETREPSDRNVFRLGYWLIESARGRGLGCTAASYIVPWVWNHTEAKAIELRIRAANHASAKLAARLGFTVHRECPGFTDPRTAQPVPPAQIWRLGRPGLVPGA